MSAKDGTIAGLHPVSGDTPGVSHMLHADSPNCPKCGAPPSKHAVRNHSLIWGDGDVHCTECDAYVRAFDSS